MRNPDVPPIPSGAQWRRRHLLASAGGGGLALLGLFAACSRSPRAAGTEPAHDVLAAIPTGLHAAIRNGTVSADLQEYFVSAARHAVASGRPLLVPRGTYTMHTWSPPAHLTVFTSGRDTVFKQLDTGGKPQRFIEVAADGIRLWPDGAATIDGGMTLGGINATQFNSGVRVHAAAGTRIDSFVCGDIYGIDIGGDVLETGSAADGHLGHCRIGTLTGDNIYRNILSVTGGSSGTVEAVIQAGGCGLMAVDFEPDPTSGSIRDWSIGTVKGHRVSVVGDQAVNAGSVRIDRLDLDFARPVSRPAFNSGGISAARTPAQFRVGFRYRNARSIEVGRAVIVGFPRGAIEDIGFSDADSPCDQVRFGSLEVRNCGIETGYQITTQKTRLFQIDLLRDIAKSDQAVGTFVGGHPMCSTRVNGGQATGRLIYQMAGGFEARNLTVAGSSQAVFRHATGPIRLDRVTCTGARAMFENCSGEILVEDSTLEASTILRASPRARFIRTSINRVFHQDRRASSDP